MGLLKRSVVTICALAIISASAVNFQGFISDVHPRSTSGGQAHLADMVTSTTVPVASESADPDVIRSGSSYIEYSTNASGMNVPVRSSTDLVHWTAASDAFPAVPGWASRGFIWAPSVTLAPDGTYVLYFSSFDSAVGSWCIGRATSASPKGPFHGSGSPFLCDVASGGVIDPSVFVEGNSTYLLWKTDGEQGQGQSIMSQKLYAVSGDLVGDPVRLLSANESWEDGVVEGPSMTVVSGHLYLFYSAGHWWNSEYSIGWASCTSPTGTCTANGTPLLTSSRGVSGPGGPATITIGNAVVLTYAAWPKVDGKLESTRSLFTGVLTDSNGVPQAASGRVD
jgi:beta-xylosidase